MEGYCSTGQSPQRAVVPTEEEEKKIVFLYMIILRTVYIQGELKVSVHLSEVG
jgi:hypothetical protein